MKPEKDPRTFVFRYTLNDEGTPIVRVLNDRGQDVGDSARSTLLEMLGGVPNTSTSPKVMMCYRPSKSTFPEWATSLIYGSYTWDDIDSDIKILKDMEVDFVRILVHYDHQWRANEPGGWVRNGVFQTAYGEVLRKMIKRLIANGFSVVVTAFQSAPALKPTDDWSWLDTDRVASRNYVKALAEICKDFPSDRIVFNVQNEPDGYGVSADPVLFGRVVEWLDDMASTWKATFPGSAVVVNTSVHDTMFRRVKTDSPGVSCIADISDWYAFNSFRWADTGNWSGVSLSSQIKYVKDRAYKTKPIWLFESGFPRDYVNQGAGQASLVPWDESIFDRPQGRAGGIAHTAENQTKAVEEAAYHCWRLKIDGVGFWSAYMTNGYHDSFGIVGNAPAEDAVKNALKGRFGANGLFRLSLVQGYGSAKINGVTATAAGTDYVPAGVLISAGQSWTSDRLPVSAPCKLRFAFTLDTAPTVEEPFIIRIITSNNRFFDWRWKKYTANAYQMIRVENAVDNVIGWLPSEPMLAGAHQFEMSIGEEGWDIFGQGYRATKGALASWETEWIRVYMSAAASAPTIRITGMWAVGTPGELLPIALPPGKF